MPACPGNPGVFCNSRAFDTPEPQTYNPAMESKGRPALTEMG